MLRRGRGLLLHRVLLQKEKIKPQNSEENGVRMSIEIKNLTKQYGERTAVNNVSFTLVPNQPFAILGRNGAGKSTIIKSLLGLKKPSSGKIIFPEGLRVGYLPEERGVYSDATVEEHIELFGRISGVSDLKKKTGEWLEELEIGQYRGYKLKNLSKGTAQKVQLIITLLHDPDLLILDEPFSGLDPINTKLFLQVIERHAKGKYLLISSHQMNVVEGLCNDVLMLNHGNVVAQGHINALKERYGNRSLTLPDTPEMRALMADYPCKCSEGELILTDSDDGSRAQAVLSALLERGVHPEHLHYGQISLNDLFIYLLKE